MLSTVTIKEVKSKISEWVKQQRKLHNLSQEELGEALDISRFTIQKLESGGNATLNTLLKVVNHFDGLDMLHQQLDEAIKKNDFNSLY